MSAFVRRPVSAGIMSAVAGCVLTAAVSDARSPAPLSGMGRNGRERKAECQVEDESKCEPFHGESFRFNGSIRVRGCERGKRANHNRLAWRVNGAGRAQRGIAQNVASSYLK